MNYSFNPQHASAIHLAHISRMVDIKDENRFGVINNNSSHPTSDPIPIPSHQDYLIHYNDNGVDVGYRQRQNHQHQPATATATATPSQPTSCSKGATGVTAASLYASLREQRQLQIQHADAARRKREADDRKIVRENANLAERLTRIIHRRPLVPPSGQPDAVSFSLGSSSSTSYSNSSCSQQNKNEEELKKSTTKKRSAINTAYNMDHYFRNRLNEAKRIDRANAAIATALDGIAHQNSNNTGFGGSSNSGISSNNAGRSTNSDQHHHHPTLRHSPAFMSFPLPPVPLALPPSDFNRFKSQQDERQHHQHVLVQAQYEQQCVDEEAKMIRRRALEEKAAKRRRGRLHGSYDGDGDKNQERGSSNREEEEEEGMEKGHHHHSRRTGLTKLADKKCDIDRGFSGGFRSQSQFSKTPHQLMLEAGWDQGFQTSRNSSTNSSAAASLRDVHQTMSARAGAGASSSFSTDYGRRRGVGKCSSGGDGDSSASGEGQRVVQPFNSRNVRMHLPNGWCDREAAYQHHVFVTSLLHQQRQGQAT